MTGERGHLEQKVTNLAVPWVPLKNASEADLCNAIGFTYQHGRYRDGW